MNWGSRRHRSTAPGNTEPLLTPVPPTPDPDLAKTGTRPTDRRFADPLDLACALCGLQIGASRTSTARSLHTVLVRDSTPFRLLLPGVRSATPFRTRCAMRSMHDGAATLAALHSCSDLSGCGETPAVDREGGWTAGSIRRSGPDAAASSSASGNRSGLGDGLRRSFKTDRTLASRVPALGVAGPGSGKIASNPLHQGSSSLLERPRPHSCRFKTRSGRSGRFRIFLHAASANRTGPADRRCQYDRSLTRRLQSPVAGHRCRADRCRGMGAYSGAPV